MATVAIVTVGIAGRVNASFEIARRLETDGHEMVFASADSRALNRVRAEGYPCFQLDTAVPEALRQQLRRSSSGGVAGGMKTRQLRARIAKARGTAALSGYRIDEFISQYRPGLLLVESELHETILYLLGSGANMALLEYHVSTSRARGVPPLNSPAQPVGPFKDVRAAAIWRWSLLKRALRLGFRRWDLRGWDERSVWRRIARRSGKRLEDLARKDQWPLLQYPQLPCLHLCAAEFDFPHTARRTGDFVGPMIQKKRNAAPGETDADACRELLEQIRPAGRPLVACATGSILSLPAFLRKVVRAAEGGGFEMILATGLRCDPAMLGKLPPNVHAFRYIPQLDVLAGAALFICHGGISSIHESLLAGVPMLVYSGRCLDENGNAARVAWHGLGMRGNLRRDSAADIRARIDTLLADAKIRDNVAAMREILLRYERDGLLGMRVQALLGEDAGRTPAAV